MKWVYGCMCSWSVCTTLRPRDKKLEQILHVTNKRLLFYGSPVRVQRYTMRVWVLGGLRHWVVPRRGKERRGEGST